MLWPHIYYNYNMHTSVKCTCVQKVYIHVCHVCCEASCMSHVSYQMWYNTRNCRPRFRRVQNSIGNTIWYIILLRGSTSFQWIRNTDIYERYYMYVHNTIFYFLLRTGACAFQNSTLSLYLDRSSLTPLPPSSFPNALRSIVIGCIGNSCVLFCGFIDTIPQGSVCVLSLPIAAFSLTI